MSKHTVVWLDHNQAHILQLHEDKVEESNIKSHHHDGHTSKASRQRQEDAKHFFHNISEALRTAEEILLVGPSTAKLDFLRYAHTHASAIENKIVGVETVDHPTDKQLAAYGKEYFKRRDWPRTAAAAAVL